MQWIDFFGYIGSVLSSITFFPQVYKTWKTKSAEDLSVIMLLIILFSTVVWLVYGFGKNATPIIVCNGIVFVLSVFLLYFKLTYKS